jgi:hypothetical protein
LDGQGVREHNGFITGHVIIIQQGGYYYYPKYSKQVLERTAVGLTIALRTLAAWGIARVESEDSPQE